MAQAARARADEALDSAIAAHRRAVDLYVGWGRDDQADVERFRLTDALAKREARRAADIANPY